VGAVYDLRICRPNRRSNNRLERSGTAPAAQPARWADQRSVPP
jgi:hypothetical protein